MVDGFSAFVIDDSPLTVRKRDGNDELPVQKVGDHVGSLALGDEVFVIVDRGQLLVTMLLVAP